MKTKDAKNTSMAAIGSILIRFRWDWRSLSAVFQDFQTAPSSSKMNCYRSSCGYVDVLKSASLNTRKISVGWKIFLDLLIWFFRTKKWSDRVIESDLVWSDLVLSDLGDLMWSDSNFKSGFLGVLNSVGGGKKSVFGVFSTNALHFRLKKLSEGIYFQKSGNSAKKSASDLVFRSPKIAIWSDRIWSGAQIRSDQISNPILFLANWYVVDVPWCGVIATKGCLITITAY